MNTGNVNVTVTNWGTTGDYAVTGGTCGALPYALTPSAGCTLTIAFTPTAATAPDNGTLTLTTSAGSQTVPLTGAGLAATLAGGISPTSASFGSVQVNTQSSGVTFFIRNSGTQPLIFSTAATMSGSFVLATDGCGVATLSPGESCYLVVTFAPTSVGTLTGTITLATNAGTVKANLTGTGTPVLGGTPTYFAPPAVSFDQQAVNSISAATTVSFYYNGSSTNFALTGATITAGSANFQLASGASAVNTCTAPLGVTSCQVNLVYSPSAAGYQTGTLTVTSTAGSFAVALSGYAPPVNDSGLLSPGALSYPYQVVSTTSSYQPLTLYNTGAAAFTVGTVGGANFGPSSEFQALAAGYDTCSGATLAPVNSEAASGGSCYVYVVFAPSAGGTRTGTITFPVTYSDGTTGTFTANLTGVGAAQYNKAVLSPTLATFTDTTVGTENAPQLIYLYNSGNLPFNVGQLTGTDLVIGSPANTDFFIGPDYCSNVAVAVGSSCYVDVGFQPVHAGADSGSIVFPVTYANSTKTVTFTAKLTGNGIAANPAITVSPAGIQFDSVTGGMGVSANYQVVSVTNTGNAPVIFGTDTLSLGFGFNSDGCKGTTVAPGSSCPIYVYFNPSASSTGTIAGTLSINSNATGGAQTVALSGISVSPSSELQFSQSTVSFGNQLLNIASGNVTVFLINRGTSPVNITSLAIGGANAFDFGETDTCAGNSLAANSSCSLSIAFGPTATGARLATLTEKDSGSGGPRSITLTGTGVNPSTAVTFFPAALTFGAEVAGLGGAPQIASVTNIGVNPVTITGIASTDTTQFPVRQTTCTGATLTMGQSCLIYVAFAPASAGSPSAFIQVTDNASGSPQKLPVSGTGNPRLNSSVTVTATPASAPYGSLFTLVAAAQDQNGSPATNGSVTFYNGANALGTAQVVTTASGGGTVGTATLKTFLQTLGANSIVAKFKGGYGPSTSSPAVATVTGQYPAATTLSSSGSAGNYTLTGTVAITGPTAATGNILFADTTTSLGLGTVSIGASSLAQTFVAAPTVTGMTGALVEALADLNGDGIPDLVTGTTTGLFVQLGNGDGTFQAPKQVATGAVGDGAVFGVQPGSSIVFGDFNGDGKLDIAFIGCVNSSSPCSVEVMLGNGDGTFRAAQAYDTTSYIAGIAVGDFNGDGIQDIVVANYNSAPSGTVDLLLGNGDGTFQPPISIAVGWASSVAVADLNGDGKLDIVATNWSQGTVTVLLGNGNGTFQPIRTFPTVAVSSNATLADLRSVGKLDLVVLDDTTGISVLLGNGDGTFQPSTPVYSSSSPSYLASIAVADLNGNGKPDIVAVDYGSSVVWVLPGNGDGTFQSPISYPTAAHSVGVAIGDMNHDGRPDIAVANQTANSVTVLLNQVTEAANLNNVLVPGTGTHAVVGVYSGDTNFPSGTSNTLQLAASLVTPTMTLTALPGATVPWGQLLSMKVALAGAYSYVPPPSSKVGYAIDGGSTQTATLSAGAVTISLGQLGVGTHLIAVTYGGDQYYSSLAAQTLQVTVNQATQTITFGALASVTYGVAPYALSATASSGLPVAFSVVSGPATVTPSGMLTVTGAGTVVIAANQAGNANYSAAAQVTQSLNVALAPLTVTVNSAPKVYGAPLPAFSGTIQGTVNGDKLTATYSSTATAASPVGSYPITAVVSGPAAANYAVTVKPGTLSVTRATLTITANSLGSVYGSPLPAFTFTVGGLVNKDTAATAFTGAPSLTSSATAKSAVGSYPIAAAAGTMVSANYSFQFAPGTFSISSALLTVTATSFNIVFGAPIPNLTYSTSGFLNGDTQAVVTGAPSATTTAVQGSAAGTYPIHLGLGTLSASNYIFALVDGNLSIAQAPPTLIWIAPAPMIYGTPLSGVQLNASSTVPGTFAYNPPFGQVLNGGAQTLSTTFTPSDNIDYSVATASVFLAVNPAMPTVTVTPSSGTITSAQPLTVMVAVSGVAGNLIPTGSVTLSSGSYNSGATPLTGGSASIVAGAGSLPTGTDTLTATYTPDSASAPDYSGATGTASVKVIYTAKATTTLSVTPASAAFGSPFTLAATVTDQGGTPLTTGSVTFYDGSKALGTAQVVGTASVGAALGTVTLKTILVPLGANSITAKYTIGTASSLSQAVTATVTGQYPSTTTLSSSGSAGSYTLTGTVAGGGPVAPTGNVLFTDTTTGLAPGTAPLSAASLAQTFVAVPFTTDLNSPLAVAFADLNGDGIPDLVASSSFGSLIVQLGNGDGTFQAPSFLDGGEISYGGFAFGDFNGDGKLDIASAACVQGTNNCSVRILLGNGDGTFQKAVSYGYDASSSAIAVGDFNGDGVLDLAVGTSFNGGGIELLLGNGDGSFQTASLIPTPQVPTSVVVGDVNGDGKLDLVSNSGGDQLNQLSVMLGNGEGSFQAAKTYTTPSNINYVALADIRGVGKPDILTLNWGNGVGSVDAWFGNGDGTFQTPTNAVYTNSSFELNGLAVADLNGDGKVDLVVSVGGLGDELIVLPGNGDGTFQSPVTYGTGATVPAIADLNHDGRPDIGVADTMNSRATILLNQVSQTATLNNVPLPGLGTHSVSATYQGDSNFTASTSNTLQLAAGQVTPGMSLAAAPSATAAYGLPLSVVVTLSTPLSFAPAPTGTVSYSIDGGAAQAATLAGGVVSVPVGQLNVGSHSFTVTYGGDQYYAAVAAQTLTLTVTQAPQTISCGSLSGVTYGAAPFAPSCTASSGLPVVLSVSSGPAAVANGLVTLTGAGTVTLAANQGGNADYSAAAQVTESFNVAQAPLTVTVNPAAKVYGAPLPVFSATMQGLVNLDRLTVSYSPNATASSAVGSYSVNATLSGLGLANYAPVFSPGTLTVTKAALTITANNMGSVYGAALPAPTYSVGGLVNNDTAASAFSGAPSLACSATAKSPVGIYPITVAAGTMASANYSFQFVSGMLTIARAQLTVTANKQSVVYGAQIPALTYSIAGFVNGDTQALVSGAPSLSTTAAQGSMAGPYPIHTSLGTLAASNYTFSLVDGWLTIGKASPTIIWATPAPYPYGTPLGGAQMNATSTVAGTFAYSAPAGTIARAGLHTLVATFTPNDSTDYGATTASVTVTVTPAVLTVMANNAARAYGAANPAFTCTITGFVNGETASVVSGGPKLGTSAISTSPVGTYPITVGQGSLWTANYTFSLVNGQLTITKPPPTVTWPIPAPITYGTALSGTQLNANSTAPGSFAYSPSAGTVLGSGTQTLTVVFTPTDAVDYSPVTRTVQFQVNRAPLTAVATNVSRPYGAPNPSPFAYTINGFVNQDTQAVVSGAPTLATTATSSSKVGFYDITVGMGTLSASNYSFTPVKGTLTVTQATPAIVWDNPAPIVFGTPLSATQLNATSPVKGGFTYAPVAGTVLYGGQTTLFTTFKPADAANYTTAAASVTQVVSPALPAVGVTLSAASITQVQSLTVTVAVHGMNGLVPSGWVTLSGGSYTSQAATLVSGSAVIVITRDSLASGSDTLTATYTPDPASSPNYAISTGSAMVTVVNSVNTATTLAVAPASAAFGSTFKLTATVMDSTGKPVTNGGSVTFYDGATALGTAQVVRTASGGAAIGTAAIKMRLAPLGANSLTAKYTIGTAGSVSTPVMATVTGKYPATAALTSSGAAGNYTLTGIISAAGPAAPTGTIQFTDSTTQLAPGTQAIAAGSLARTFVPASTTGAGNNPQMISADINGDGIPDLVLANHSGTMITVLLGKGDGTFTVLPSFGTKHNGVYEAAVGDLNGDGNLDIATVNGNSVSIFIGNGDGTFGAETDYQAPGTAVAVGMGDFNGDGKLDLAIANNTPNGVSVLIGNGDGTFQGGTVVYPVGKGPDWNVVVRDFNGDGKLDVAVADSADNTVSVLLGNGDGTFQPQAPYPVGSNPSLAFAADLRSDGGLDLVTLNRNDNSIGVLLGNGDGTFQKQHAYALGSTPKGAVSGDLNGDGKLDLVVASNTAGTLSILSGNGDGTFQPQQLLRAVSAPVGLVAADFNGDGRQDIAYANSSANTVPVLLNQVAQTVNLPNVALPGTGSHVVTATYSGDSNFTAGTSKAVQLTAGLVTPTMTVAAPSGTSIQFGQALNLNIALTGPLSFVPAPTRQVSYSIDGGAPQMVTLAGGAATVSISQLSAGSHSIAVAYTGDQYYTPLGPQALKANVTPQTETIACTPITNVTYSPTLITLSCTTNSGLPVSFSVFSGPATVSGKILKTTGAGPVVLLASQSGNQNYKAATPVQLNFTVAKAPLTVTVNSATKVYGAQLPQFSGKIQGTVNGDQLAATYSTSATPSSPVGQYQITASLSGASLPNYAVTINPGAMLTITPAMLTVTADNLSSVYGVQIPARTYTILGFVNGDKQSVVSGAPQLSTIAVPGSPVGIYSISVSQGSLAASNYTFTLANGKLTITKATPAITWAQPAPITFGTPLSGTQLNAASTVSGKPTYSPAAGSTVPVGSHALSVTWTPTDGTDYNSNTATVTLQVNPAPVTLASIAVTPASASIAAGASLQYAATGTYSDGSNRNLTASAAWSSSNNAVAAISTSGLATAAASGSSTISASSSGITSNLASLTVVAGAYSAPTEPVGATSGAQSATILLPKSLTLGSIAVVTQGAPELDFNLASGGSCAAATAYTAGQTCTVNYTFKPMAPGTRYGAINLYDNTTPTPVLQATVYLNGTGTGPLVNFLPGTQGTLANTLNSVEGVATDASGSVYIANWADGVVYKETPSAGGYIQNKINAGGSYGTFGVAVDGSGNVYWSNFITNQVMREAPSGGGYTENVVANAALNGINNPEGVAVDGNGNVYIADVGNNRVVKEIPTAGSFVQSTVAVGLCSGFGLAADGAGNAYIADSCNSRVLKESPSGSGYTQTVIANATTNGLLTPMGVAVDGVGNVYIADTNNGRVLKETLSGSGYTQSTVAAGLTKPQQVAVDGSGNVYAVYIVNSSSNTQILKLDLADPPSLSFATATVGSTSSGSPQSVTLWNNGNTALNFPVPSSGANPSISTNFALDSTTTCPQLTPASAAATLAPGANCTYAVDFVPTAVGALSGALALTDNNLNGASAMQTLALNGTGVTLVVGTATGVSSSQSPSTYGQSVTFTAAITPASGTATPAGTVQFSVDGNSTGTAQTLIGGTARITTSGLAAGKHTVTAAFTPTAGSSFGASSSKALTQMVNKATPPITWPTPTAIIYGTPLSGTQFNATSPVTGKFAYNNAPGTVLGAGSQALSVTFTPTDTNDYTAANASVTLVVNPAVLTVTATNVSVVFGQPIPPLTSYSVTGYANNDTSSVLTGAPNLSTTATKGSAVASYTITITQGTLAAANYTFQFVSGILTITQVGTAAAPSFSLPAGTYTSVQSVTISDATTGAAIYYTTDGSVPAAIPADLYTGPIAVPATTKVIAIATAPGYAQSPMATALYAINLPPAATPAFTPIAGTYTSAQTVTLGDSTPGATIYYTTDGSVPAANPANKYTAPFIVAKTTTVNAIATAPGYSQSAVGSAPYSITGVVATPSFSPSGGSYNSVQTVTIADATPGSTIYYTTDGSIPAAIPANKYTGQFVVSKTTIVNAIATETGYTQSQMGTALYTITPLQAAEPVFNPAPGDYGSKQSVTIKDSTPGAVIYFRCNIPGAPCSTAETLYDGNPISISQATIFTAYAVASGYSQSETAVAVYNIGNQ
jgi:hypothetical protein